MVFIAHAEGVSENVRVLCTERVIIYKYQGSKQVHQVASPFRMPMNINIPVKYVVYHLNDVPRISLITQA